MRQLRLLIGTLVTVGLLAGLVVSPAYADPPFDPPGLARAMAAQEGHTNSLMVVPGVVGTAVGLGAGGQAVVKIYTESAAVAGLPRTLDGVPVVIQVTGKLFALKHECGHKGPPCNPDPDPAPNLTPKDRWPLPVPIGVSTGHPAITAGTIGARLIDGAGNVYALSNNHIYADENGASILDKVLQPGPFDGGTDPADAIGTLYDFEPIVFSTSASNEIDAAIAVSSTANLDNQTLSNGYGTPKSETASPSPNDRVQKCGRTTGCTKGRITGINATLDIGYDSGVARFVNQIVIQPGSFSAPGDSGSLVVGNGRANKRKPVGLVFAGNILMTIANPIDPILARFGVTIDGE